VSFEFHEPGDDDESEEGYVYHATNHYGAYDIADDGHLRTHKPWYGTDQRAWPDGSTKKRAYFSNQASGVHWFAPEEGRPAVLRVHRDNHPFHRESGTGDVYTRKKIPTKHVQVRHADGSWHPISKLAEPKEPEEPVKKTESLLLRSPLLLERSHHSYAAAKEKSFRGGKYNRHTPREGHWLPKQVKPKHSEGIYRKGPKGKRRRRRGSYLRDEPLRKRAEPIRHRIKSSIDLMRTKLLLDHDKPT
jgi:hypothetical protein